MKVLVTADFCPKDRVASLIENEDYQSVFGQVKPIVEQSDYSIVNFECPICTTEGFDIKKAGPSLKCSAKSVEALKYARFDCVTLANNHFYDQGEQGVRETIEALDNATIDHVGGGFNLGDATQTLYKIINNQTLAIINCCEHEFSIATEITGGSNPLNPIKQYQAICEARQKANYVLVIVHGGIEHFQLPSPRMKETYRFFIDVGADAVVNHHQHCYSGFELYQGKPIFYGLGNFCFDNHEFKSKLWEEGFMVMLTFDDQGVKYRLYPYNQNGVKPGIQLKEDKDALEWNSKFDSISKIISDDKELKIKYDAFLKKTERLYSARLTPYSSRIALSLYMRHMLPKILPKQKLLVLLNTILCESHHDRMIHMLRSLSK